MPSSPPNRNPPRPAGARLTAALVAGAALLVAALTAWLLASAGGDEPNATLVQPPELPVAPGHPDELMARLDASASAASDAAPARWAVRGAWGRALEVVESTPEPTRLARLNAYRWAVIGHWVGALDRVVVDRARSGLGSALEGNEPAPADLSDDALSGSVEDARAELAWLDGIAGAIAREGDAIDLARLRLTESSAPTSTDLERSLRALQLALDDEELRAARLLRRLEQDREDGVRFADPAAAAHPFLTAVNRLAAAQWFIKHGKASDALPMLGWWEAGDSAPETAAADLALASLDHLQRARALREMGDGSSAAEYFRAFLRAYDLPAEAHRQWVADAHAAVATQEGR